MRFKDKVVLITGGASGIGRTAAIGFAHEGARVMIADYDAFRARDTLADLQDITENCDWVRADMREEGQIVRMKDKTLQSFGRIDVLVNNAAGFPVAKIPLDQVSTDAWDADYSMYLRHAFLCTKHVLPEMVRTGGGAIVNTSSIDGLIVSGPTIAYSAAKAAIISLTKHTALHYGKYNVRANCVCPGITLTQSKRASFEANHDLVLRYPIGRLGSMKDIAEAYLYLASPEASFVTGTALVVDGGYTTH